MSIDSRATQGPYIASQSAIEINPFLLGTMAGGTYNSIVGTYGSSGGTYTSIAGTYSSSAGTYGSIA